VERAGEPVSVFNLDAPQLINSGCIGMIKPLLTQRRQRKGREMNNSDANGFDISPDRLTFRVGRFLFIVTKIYS
jgi:hypothetical protein